MASGKENRRFPSFKINEGNELSPLTDLTNNLGNLSTFNFIETPKRILTFTDSPELNLSSSIDAFQENNSLQQKEILKVTKTNNEDNKMLGYLNMDNIHKTVKFRKNKSNCKQVTLFSKQSDDSADSGYSKIKSDISLNHSTNTSFASLLSNDDGFFNEIDENSQILTKFDENSQMPSKFINLITKPIVISSVENCKKENDISAESSLNNSKEFNQTERNKSKELSLSLKNDDTESKTQNNICPINCKRRRFATSTTSDLPSEYSERSVSLKEVAIMNAMQLSIQEPDLIGDFSKPYALPLIEGNNELQIVKPATVAQLLRGHYQNIINSYTIIDCRYPYEYAAGHIIGSKNIFTKHNLYCKFLSDQKLADQKPERNILLFHCEFSSERGPSLCRFLRNKDREINREVYPNLHYPEMYIIKGGYKAFFENFKDLCEPQAYKPMLHKDHEVELRKFRKQTKAFRSETKRLNARTSLKF